MLAGLVGGLLFLGRVFGFGPVALSCFAHLLSNYLPAPLLLLLLVGSLELVAGAGQLLGPHPDFALLALVVLLVVLVFASARALELLLLRLDEALLLLLHLARVIRPASRPRLGLAHQLARF